MEKDPTSSATASSEMVIFVVGATEVKLGIVLLLGGRSPLGGVPILPSSPLGFAGRVLRGLGEGNGGGLLLDEGIKLGRLLQGSSRRGMSGRRAHDGYGPEEVGIGSGRRKKRRG